MKLRTLFIVGLMVAVYLYADAPRGTVPREAADKYPAHITQGSVSVGAVVLTPGQTRKAFASDIDSCCVVVEVAFYPKATPLLPFPAISISPFPPARIGKDLINWNTC